ncbi:MAG TPA: hypothetical protein VMH30_04770 [Verrucomicrobiae bacterium]|nr:hypothetical protein [Verrucomicrobiae bacterium]
MKTIAKHGATLLLGLALRCCYAAETMPSLPADISLNPDAGRGNWIIVAVGLADGEKLPFIVDTGLPVTVFDPSLEPLLGKRLNTATLWNFGVGHHANVYRAPKLYLGDTLLISATNVVAVYDCRHYSEEAGQPIRGILGMDVLGNYCIQLNFQKETMRFLDAERAEKGGWGAPFPLKNVGDGCFYISNNLVGVQGPGSLVDTGTDGDGWLLPELFQQWTNPATADGAMRAPEGALGGEIYRDLELDDLGTGPKPDKDSHLKLNIIGIHVLSENLVTLDFPEREVFLKRTSEWPLNDQKAEATARDAGRSAAAFLRKLKLHGQLPGWKKMDDGRTTAFHFHRSAALDSVTIDGAKVGDSSVYHYTLTRAVNSGRWKLQRAWRTDQNGKTFPLYPND